MCSNKRDEFPDTIPRMAIIAYCHHPSQGQDFLKGIYVGAIWDSPQRATGL